MNSTTGSDAGQPLLPESLKFFGEITASVTHELSNVLSTIEQVVGLIEDLAEAGGAQEAGITEKLLSVVERVGKQSERGATLIRRLNGFAHLSDAPVADCILGDLLENITALSERFARLRKVPLSTTGFDREIIVRSSPWLLTQTMFCGINRALLVADPAAPLEIRLIPRDQGGEIIFESQCRAGVTPCGATDDMQPLVARLGGHVEEAEDAGRYRIKVTIPHQVKDMQEDSLKRPRNW